MKKTVKLYSLILAAGIIFVFSAVQNASAAPIAFDLSTGNDGLSLTYTLPFFGGGDILLESQGDDDSININIFIIQLANIQLTHNGLSDNEIIDALNIELTMSFFFDIFKFDPIEIPVPFGDYEMEVDPFGKVRKDVPVNADMGFSFLLSPNSYEYEITAKDLPFVAPINIPEGTENEFTVDIIPAPPEAFDSFGIDVTLSPYWLPFLTQVEIQIDDSAPITIPLPNGAYYLSLDYPDES